MATGWPCFIICCAAAIRRACRSSLVRDRRGICLCTRERSISPGSCDAAFTATSAPLAGSADSCDAGGADSCDARGADSLAASAASEAPRRPASALAARQSTTDLANMAFAHVQHTRTTVRE
eukprot:5870926-Prymnesium_polylepis.1